MTLWFQLASASVKLGNLHNVRGALVEGLACSPHHWPCLENLITVTFKLCDNYGCLSYCAMALERDPNNKKAIEYKSRVYQEMPFLQEYLGDEKFVPVPVEREVYSYLPPPAKPLPSLTGRLDSLTLAGLADTLLDIYSTAEGEQLVSRVDGEAMLEQHAARALAGEEAKITVSVQNLVTEMVDMLEGEERAGREEAVQLADTILERLLCDMLGVEPLTEPELLCRDLLAELAGEAGPWTTPVPGRSQ